jgi:long-chain acyl-CoA synthetase
MFIDLFLERFEQAASRDALVWRDQSFNYKWICDSVRGWIGRLRGVGSVSGQVTVLEGDFSPTSVAIFLALVEIGAVLVPLTKAAGEKRGEFLEVAEAEVIVCVSPEESVTVKRTGRKASHQIYAKLRDRAHPGLVLFSSGSTGKSKAAVHDLVPLLKKFETPRRAWRTISFLLYDHIGGVNTMLYTLSNGGCTVTVQDRSPEAVLTAIELHRVELLPTSPTFLNLILISEAWQHHDLSSLRLVTYGTETMPESTLRRFHELFPNIQLLQTYGLSELGILRSRSRSSDSLWVKIGGEGFQTRIVNGILQIKAESAMLGYLNAPSPFTEDGWFDTRDRVEQDGEYLRILGRDSEIINVGGEKVYPSEVESVIQELENIVEAVVYGAKNPITGNIVCARVSTDQPEDPSQLAVRIKKHCSERLQRFKVPVKVELVQGSQHNERFKRVR